MIFIILVAGFAALLVFRGYQHNTQDQQTVQVDIPKVRVIAPVLYQFRDTVSFTAEIEPENRVAVICKVPGKNVLQVNVEEGDTVEQGQLMAELDDALVKQDIARARAMVSGAEVQYRVLRSDYVRMKDLLEEEVISQQRFDHVEAEYRAAGSQLRQARVSLEQLETLQGYHRITAPISGMISKRNIDPGDTATSQLPLFLIFQQKDLKIRGAVAERPFLSLKEGQSARVEIDALPGRVFQATVSRLSPALDPVTRTGEVELSISSEDILKPGIFARVSIQTGSHETLALPKDVIRPLPGTGEFQFFVLSGDRAEQRIVTIGSEENNMVEIPGGLSPEDRVIATITDKLRDGIQVEVSGE